MVHSMDFKTHSLYIYITQQQSYQVNDNMAAPNKLLITDRSFYLMLASSKV